ncbi:MAG TPA: hypothetical protein VH374_08235 [Polyangia bacterium]|jgi:hypothetical protein|nr:hypothetical protein [Polyangia bacterium]
MRHRPRSPRFSNARATGALLLLATVIGAGCGADFDPYDRLTELRVLAVKSDPVAPAPGETTTLSALVYTPPPADATTPAPVVGYDWSWCPFAGTANDGYPCLVTEDQLQMLSGVAVSFSLGSAPTAMFTHSFPPQLLDTICKGVPGLPPPPNCDDGFPVTIKVVVHTDTDSVTAIRTLKLLMAPAPEPNTNPTMGGLFVTVDGMDLPLDSTVMLHRRANNDLKASVTVDAAEVYQGLDDNGNPAQLTERLFLSWFVETGTLKHARTGYNATTTSPFADLLTNVWVPERAQVYPAQTAQLIVVLRDNRDGVAWTTATARLEPTP